MGVGVVVGGGGRACQVWETRLNAQVSFRGCETADRPEDMMSVP